MRLKPLIECTGLLIAMLLPLSAKAAMRALSGVALLAVLDPVAIASAQTATTTYTYDARGRLVKSQHTGGPDSGLETTVTYDPADNRTNITTVGARKRVVVVPLSGFTVIPLDK